MSAPGGWQPLPSASCRAEENVSPSITLGPGELRAAGWAARHRHVLLLCVYLYTATVYVHRWGGGCCDIKAALTGRCYAFCRATGDALVIWGQLLS